MKEDRRAFLTKGSVDTRTSSLRKIHHGTNRKQHKSVTPTLGSYGRIVGPAADVKELEYISSLHQNAETLLRLDGTLSSQDIIPYLSSRYGLEISAEQGIDIACNLCGAKPRNKFSAKKDAREQEIKRMTQSSFTLGAVTAEQDEKDDGEKVFYFDLVQVMSLLLIPELKQLADQYNTRASRLTNEERSDSFLCDLSSPITFQPDKPEGRASRIFSSGAYEPLKRSSEASGKKDDANVQPGAYGIIKVAIESLIEIFDEKLQEEIRQGRPLDIDLLQHILESFGDSDSANDPKLMKQMLEGLGPKGSGLTVETFTKALTSDVSAYDESKAGASGGQKSVFFGVFNRNWDEGNVSLDSIKAKVVETASFIDYAADTYRSVLHNTTVWCLFILTTLIYLTYMLKIVHEELGGIVCTNTENFGCNVVNKVIGWLLTATFCGLYGVSVILPPSVGNVSKKRKVLLFAVAMTALFTYLPFGTLFWYRKGSPRYVETVDFHRVVCPGPLLNETFPKNLTSYDPRLFLFLDSYCYPLYDWCKLHTEVQGKYYDENPDVLSEEEFQKCYRFVFSELGGFGLWSLELPEYYLWNVPFKPPTEWIWFENYTKVGCSSRQECEKQNLTKHFCFDHACWPEPEVCPHEDVAVLGGFRLDPFCRTVNDWCYTFDYHELSWNLFGLDHTSWNLFDQDTACYNVIKKLEKHKLLTELDEKDAELDHTVTTTHPDSLEQHLEDTWIYYILLSTAIVGGLAVLSMLLGFLPKYNNDDRPRDYTMKCAAANKVANLIENALSMHAVKDVRNAKGQTMRNFFLHGQQVVEVGGVPWTLKQIMSGELFSEEGVRFPGRLWIGLVTQLVVTIIGFEYGPSYVEQWGNQIEWLHKEVGFHYRIDEISDRDWPSYTQADLRMTAEQEEILNHIPEKWMILAAGYTAFCFAAIVALFCILVYVPSYTNTVLKLRNGMISSLHDPNFQGYRETPDDVVQNIGNMVFSLMGAAVLTAVIVFGVVFVFVWPTSRHAVVGYVAIAIGMATAIVVKVLGQKMLRSRNFSNFYRKRAKSANYANLFFECWYIGTGLLVVVTRLITFLIAGGLWLGRIDTFFLHQNVKVLGKYIDRIPVSYFRDMLVHEAHNHPYIERLGGMHLRRLRDEDFGSVAGTTWRCLFVSGLMPSTDCQVQG